MQQAQPLNLIVHIKTMWFITYSTKHSICKTSVGLNRCLIKVKAKTQQACLSQFCNHNHLLFIVLYFQVIDINPYLLQFHLLPSGSFTDSHFQEHLFLTENIKKLTIIRIVITAIIVYNTKQRKTKKLNRAFDQCESQKSNINIPQKIIHTYYY